MSALHGSSAEINTKNPVVTVDAAAPVGLFYADYCRALARWHRTKSQRDQTAVREAYRKWAIAFFGEAAARPLVTVAEERWGSAGWPA